MFAREDSEVKLKTFSKRDKELDLKTLFQHKPKGNFFEKRVRSFSLIVICIEE